MDERADSAVGPAANVENFLMAGMTPDRRPADRAHWHWYWEVVFCTQGRGRVGVEDGSVSIGPGCVVVHRPGAAHRDLSGGAWEGYWLAVRSLECVQRAEPVRAGRDHPVFSLIGPLHEASHLDVRGARALVDHLFGAIMIHLGALLGGSDQEQWVAWLTRRMARDIGDRDFDLSRELAEVPLSQRYFRRVFKERTGRSPKQMLTHLRIRRAGELLRMGRAVKDVAVDVGLDDPYYFSRLFKKHTGVCPTEYRLKHRRPDAPLE